MYIALIGDIIGSRKIADRNAVQKQLQDTIDIINSDYSSVIASEFLITLGDEFQGLLKNPYSVFDIIMLIQTKMHPVRIRFGIGIGEITTDIKKEMSIGADGPAYHLARKAVDEIKKNEKGYQSNYENIKLFSGGEIELNEQMANAILSTCAFIESKWSDKQREKIYEIMKSKTQREIADDLKIMQSSVQRAIENSGYYTYIYAIDSLKRALSGAWSKKYGY